MVQEADHFLTADRRRIFYRRFQADRPKGLVLFVHGLGEHSGRYVELAQVFAKVGLSVVAPDLRGHGRSDGRRGCIRRFDEFGEDLSRLLAVVSDGAGEVPRFVLGHSLGGLIAAHWVLSQAEGAVVRAVVISSPALGIAMPVPPLKAALGRTLSKWWPGLTMDNQLIPEQLSRDEAEVRAYVEDPLVHRRVSTRLFTEMMAAMQRVQDGATRWALPLLMVLGGSDKIVSVDAARGFFGRVPIRDKTLKTYAEYFHEPFHEKGREQTMREVADWVAERAG